MKMAKKQHEKCNKCAAISYFNDGNTFSFRSQMSNLVLKMFQIRIACIILKAVQ